MRSSRMARSSRRLAGCAALWIALSTSCATPPTGPSLACQRAGYFEADAEMDMTAQYAIALSHTFDAEEGDPQRIHQSFVWERLADLEKVCFQNRLR